MFVVSLIVIYLKTRILSFKVVQGRYSGEVENICITFWKVYSGRFVPNFIRIDRV